MSPTFRAPMAATAIALALVPAAAAAEEKSTKPRIAVLELQGKTDSKLEVSSWSWGTAPARSNLEMHSWLEAAQAGQMAPGGAGGDPDRPLIAGTVPNANARQHKPVTITKEWGAATPQIMKLERPAARGSVWIRASQPWTACRVGARYPSAEIDGYRLSGLVVSACPRAAAEGITIHYEKVERVQ